MPPPSIPTGGLAPVTTVVIPDANHIPIAALPASIVVIAYTTVCLLSSILLFYLLWSQERRFTYVSILSVLVSLATTASLAQQIHFAVDWKTIKAGQYAMRGKLGNNAGRAISNGSRGLDLGLFWIQFYTYNANALLILCWATMLFCGTWRIYPKLAWLGPLSNHPETCSKVFAIIFPAMLLSIAQIKPIARKEAVFSIVCNASLVLSATIGAVLIVLTLCKFIQSRRLLNGSTFSSNGRSLGNTYGTGTGAGEHSHQAKQAQRIIDRSIILRFTVAFVLLTLFGVCDIVLQILSFRSAQDPAGTVSSDYGTAGAITDAISFLPGVTCSIVAWAIWGTTRKFLQQTGDIFRSIFCCCCGGRARRRSEATTVFEMGIGKGMNKTMTIGGHGDHFRRLSEGNDGANITVTGGGQGVRESLKETDIRVETELTILESASESDEEGHDDNDGKARNGLAMNGPGHHPRRRASFTTSKLVYLPKT